MRWRLAVMLPLLLTALTQNVFAWQGGSTGASKSEPATAAAEPAKNQPRTETQPAPNTDTVIVLDKNGNPVEVPLGPTWEEYLKFVRERSLPAVGSLPDFYIARLQLTGQVNVEDAVASLEIEALIRVLAEERTVDIPLRLAEATLRDHSYSGPGTLAFVPTERNNGIVCRLLGAGEHTIRLKTLVAVRKTGDTSRLQLSLPPCPQSELTLTIPGERIVVRGDTTNGRTESTTQTDGTTRIRAYGLGTAVDLSWQELSTRAEVRPEIAVTSFVSVMLDPDGADIDAEQTIVATRGNFDRLTIEIPAGFNLRSLTSPTHPEIQYEQPEFPRVPIQFAGPTAGPVKLTWSLYSVTAAGETAGPETQTDNAVIPFELQGFRVEEASRHEGFLRVGVPEGFRLNAPRPDTAGRTPQLQHARLSSFQPELIGRRSSGADGSMEVWRILDPGFRAGFQLERIEPGYLVEPRYSLTCNDRLIELTAAFDVSVYRGTLQKLDLLWPEFQKQKWRVEVAGSPVDIELQLPTASSDEPSRQNDLLGMVLTEPRSKTHGKWTIELTCRAPVPEAGKPFPLNLPQVDVAIERLRSPLVRVTNERNIESTLTAARGTVAHLIPDESSDNSASNVPANLQPRVWEIDSPSIQFDVTVSAHEQQVTCSPSATLRYDNDRFEVVQRLDYSVMYEPLSRVRVDIPSEIADATISQAEFWLSIPNSDDRQKLVSVGTGLQLGETIQRSLQLPESMWGRFSIICEYSVTAPDLTAAPAGAVSEVPLIQSADAVAKSTRVEIQAPANVELHLPTETWQPELSVGRFPAWIAQGGQQRLQVEGQSSTGRASERFAVQRAALQTQLFRNGSKTNAAYLIEGDVSWLSITFPDNCNLASIEARWDGELLPAEAIRLLPDSTHSLRFDLQVEDDAPAHTLQIRYQSLDGADFSPFTSLTIQPPRFSSDVLLSESVWEITLPEDQYVFVYPENWAPQMRWQRDGVVWKRQPVGAVPTVWAAAGSSGAASPRDEFGGADGSIVPYRFSAFGHQQPLVIQSMSRPAIVMAGTGLALAIGLVLLRIPATRHVLTLLVLTFAISVVGLWHLESLQLLAQPAVFGLLLAGVGTLIDARARQKQKSSYVAYTSPSDFVVPGSSVVDIMQEETRTSPRRTPDAAGA
ncbi:hypothetical protein GC176_04975 [bacterium]|nr:hypothetical protein [bacterium]